MKENTPEEIKIRYPQGYFLIFLIKISLVTIGTEQYVWHPGWSSSYLITNGLKGNSLVAFDNKFIMYMPYNKAMG